MGCTGRGIPKATPVRTFAAPVNSSVEGKDIEFVKTSVVMSGNRVPRSPSEPDSSANGCDLIVSTLCICVRRKRRIEFRRRDMRFAQVKQATAKNAIEMAKTEKKRDLGLQYHDRRVCVVAM
jgi:hypothetical protein